MMETSRRKTFKAERAMGVLSLTAYKRAVSECIDEIIGAGPIGLSMISCSCMVDFDDATEEETHWKVTVSATVDEDEADRLTMQALNGSASAHAHAATEGMGSHAGFTTPPADEEPEPPFMPPPDSGREGIFGDPDR